MPFERQKNLSFRQQNLKQAKRKKSGKVPQSFPILRENGKKEKKPPKNKKALPENREKELVNYRF